MLSYKDKTFCASQVKVHTCDRELSEEDIGQAMKLGLPVAYGKFCNSNN